MAKYLQLELLHLRLHARHVCHAGYLYGRKEPTVDLCCRDEEKEEEDEEKRGVFFHFFLDTKKTSQQIPHSVIHVICRRWGSAKTMSFSRAFSSLHIQSVEKCIRFFHRSCDPVVHLNTYTLQRKGKRGEGLLPIWGFPCSQNLANQPKGLNQNLMERGLWSEHTNFG